MKKNYLSALAILAICGSMLGQSIFNPAVPNLEKGKLAPNTKAPIKNTQINRGGPFSEWFEPVGNVMTQKGLLLDGSPSADQDFFLAPIYMDSTTKVSSPSSTRFISDVLIGSVLDLKSTNLLPSFDQVLSKADPYTVDSLVILGSYVKATPDVDTLYVTLVWGDTTNTAVWSKRATNQTWVAPMSTWRPFIIGPKVAGAAGAAGNKVQSAAPSTNKLLIKYPLAATDSSSAGFSKFINIPLPAPVNVPANNIVSCMVTFVPGGTHVVGDVSYAFTGGTLTQNVNGFASMIWGQQNPAVNALTDYQNHQVDPTSYCMGTSYSKEQRHAVYPAAWQTSVLGDLTTAPIVQYKISGVSTVGIKDIFNNEFSMSQNIPNPFTNQTKINYQLKNAAKSVVFEIYNVAGIKMFEKTQSNANAGAYSVDINDANYSNGIYFYSLTVDGKKITKKMVVSK